LAQKHNNKFYKQSFTTYGTSHRAVHWNSKYSQYKRFEVLTSFIKDEIEDLSIIDAGCGFGEYYKYLQHHNLKPKNYLGIDCEDFMIENSKTRFPFANFKIQNILKDDLIEADYYICSGALNILSVQEVYTFIEKCFSNSKKGFIFNFLKSNNYNKLDEKDIIKFCNTLCGKLQINNNYLNNDFSIFLIK
jgi:SAM-dependent methyltransferase